MRGVAQPLSAAEGEFGLESREFQPLICGPWIFGRRLWCGRTGRSGGDGRYARCSGGALMAPILGCATAQTGHVAAGGTIAGTRAGSKANAEAANEVARASGAAAETGAGVDIVSAAGFERSV